MRTFWSRRSQPPVKFVYLTSDRGQAPALKRAAGREYALQAVAASIEAALEAVTRTGASVLVTDAELSGCTWRDVVATSRAQAPALAVVVILSSFESSQWVEVIRASAYDVVVRPVGADALRKVLLGAHNCAVAKSAVN